MKLILNLRAALSALAAILFAFFSRGLFIVFNETSTTRATGLAAVAGGFAENLLSPWFWILTIVFFALFLAASRLTSKPLRILFFWIPTTSISTVGLSLIALLAYAWIHFRST